MSRKIGLITFHESDNYGTCLQAYALQKLLSLTGSKVEIIKYSRKSVSRKATLKEKFIYFLKSYGIKNIHMRKCIDIAQVEKKKKFMLFRSVFLNYSKESFDSFDALKKTDSDYDAFVCGSDMVWAQDRAQNLNIYFLQFADEKKRIAFSPSFGSSQVSADLREEYKNYLSNFRFLSCREQSGVELIETLSGREACLTLDPTLTCDKKLWTEMTSEKNTCGDYILVYMFNGVPDNMKKKIKKTAEHYKAKIIEIPMSVKGTCDSIRNNWEVVGPVEFVQLFRHAKFVFTNSYHGLMFSLIFEKPFYVVQRDSAEHWTQFEDRMRNILKIIGCNNRMISAGSETDKFELNYDNISPLIEEYRKKSRSFLNHAINEVCGVSFRGEIDD